MSRAVIADVGPLYAAADPDDAYRGRAQRELRRLASEGREVLLAYPTLLGRQPPFQLIAQRSVIARFG